MGNDRRLVHDFSPEALAELGIEAGGANAGVLLIFYALLPATLHEELESRMVGDAWAAGPIPQSRRLAYKTLQRLERALELLTFGLTPAEMVSIRGALVPANLAPDRELGEACQRMEYLSEIHQRVRQDWLKALLARPQQFFSVFQPLIDLRGGTVTGYEMLIRARGDANGSIIGGGQLISAAQDAKLLYDLDLLARDVAIKTASRMIPQRTNVFINFMPNSILDPERSLRRSMKACEAAKLSPGRVVFEVVEAEAVKDLAFLQGMLREYREMGFKFALDDLGAGYSGLNYMHRLMPDYVKIDRELVSGSSQSDSKRVILRKITEAAHDLGIRVVAEGIETREEFEVAYDAGVDVAQGYFIARPSQDQVWEEGYRLLDEVLSRG